MDTKTVLGQIGILPTVDQGQPQPQQTQPAPVDPAKAVIDAVLNPPQAPAPTATPAPAVAPPAAPAAVDGGAPSAAGSPSTAAPSAAEPAKPPVDPQATSVWDAVLDGPKTATYSEEDTKVFQAHFGKAPQEFMASYTTMQEQMRTMQQEVADWQAFKKSWEEAPVQIRNAFDKAVARENWQEYLTKAPGFDFSKAADAQDKTQIISHYIPGSLTAEEVEALQGRDADESLKARAASLFSTASKMYEAERATHNGQIEARNAEIAKQRAETASSVDAAFAYVREKYPALAPELTDTLKADMLSFKAPFDAVMAPDGLRYSPDAAFSLIVAKNLPQVLARVGERARAQGRNEGIMEASQSVPGVARTQAAAPPPPPVATGEQDPVMTLVQQVNQKVRQSQGGDPFANKAQVPPSV